MFGVLLYDSIRRRLAGRPYWTGVFLVGILGSFSVAPEAMLRSWSFIGFGTTTLVVLAGAGVVSREIETGRTVLILTKPVTRTTWVLARLAGLAIQGILPVIVALGARASVRLAAESTDGFHTELLCCVLTVVQVIVWASALTGMSCLFRGYSNAAILYTALLVGSILGSGDVGSGWTGRCLAVVGELVRPPQLLLLWRVGYQELGRLVGTVHLMAFSTLPILVGLRFFKRRELIPLYRKRSAGAVV